MLRHDRDQRDRVLEERREAVLGDQQDGLVVDDGVVIEHQVDRTAARGQGVSARVMSNEKATSSR